MRNLIILLTLILFPLTVGGQSISKQINDIKRSSKYLSAEATLETESKAYELANELLAKQISEFIQEKGGLQNANTIIVKNVAGKIEKMQMKRGTMSRVFLYVQKSDIIAADNIRVIENNSRKNVIEKLEKTEESEDNQLRDNVASNVEMIESADTAIVSNDDEKYTTSYPTWQQEVIYTLMGSSSIKETQYLMDRFRVGLKIKRYGTMANCRNPEKCYWIIFDENEHATTVLGPGSEERTNYATQEKDSLRNYSGKGVLWFTLSN